MPKTLKGIQQSRQLNSFLRSSVGSNITCNLSNGTAATLFEQSNDLIELSLGGVLTQSWWLLEVRAAEVSIPGCMH